MNVRFSCKNLFSVLKFNCNSYSDIAFSVCSNFVEQLAYNIRQFGSL